MWKKVLIAAAIVILGLVILVPYLARPVFKPVPEQVTHVSSVANFSLPSVTLLSAPVDPRLGKADVNRTATGTYDDIYSDTANSSSYFVPGISGQALQLHAYYEDYFTADNVSALANPTFSVSFWITKDPNDQNYGHFVSLFNDTENAGWYFDVANATTQSIRFVVSNSNGTLFKTAEANLPLAKFVKITGVFDGQNVLLYENSTLVSSIKFSGQYVQAPQDPLRVGMGAFCNSCVPTGLTIDELQIYNRAVGSNEIANDTKTLSGLVRYWKFDGSLVDSANHVSGRIATLVGGMAATPDGRILFTEKNTGNIRVMVNDKVNPEPFATITDDFPTVMYGLLGITVDPAFAANHYVYAFYTRFNAQTNQAYDRIIRFTDVNSKGTAPTVIFDTLPALNGYHTGGAISFGSDGKLYISVGDGHDNDQAQNKSSLLGKLLRINKDGTIPSDNPFHDPIFTYGHRNVYGIAFDNQSGIGISTENGENLYDQVNVIKKGENYGWPNLRPADVNPQLSNSSIVKPIMMYQYTISPTQAVFYNSEKYPDLKGMFLFGSYNRGEIYGIKLDQDGNHVNEAIEIDLPQNEFLDPLVGITVTPGGDIYAAGHDVYKLTSVTIEALP